MTCKPGCKRTGLGGVPRSQLKLVTIQQQATTRNDYNEVAKTNAWTTFATAYAAIKTGSGSEQQTSGHVEAERQHTFRLSATSETRGITPQMRVAWDSRTFQIVSAVVVDEDSSGVVELKTREVV